MRKIFCLLIFLFLFCSSALSYELDTSFDDEVRKQYNIEELNEQNADRIKLPKLPDLPDDSDFDVPNPPKAQPSNLPYFPENYKGEVKILKSGLRFFVANAQPLSDRYKEGSTVTFSNLEEVNFNGITIPQGAVFRGKISEAHLPQMTGNGGLVRVEIDELAYKGNLYKISASVVKIDDKRAFGGKVKGKRQYVSNLKKSNSRGVKFNRKMVKAAKKVERYPVVAILGVVPRAVGVVTLGANGAISPISASFKRGKHAFIQKGTVFEIKLTKDVKLKA